MIIKQGYLLIHYVPRKVVDYHKGKYKGTDINKNWESIPEDELYDLYHHLFAINEDYKNGIEPTTKEKSDLCKLLYFDNFYAGKIGDGYVTLETMNDILKKIS